MNTIKAQGKLLLSGEYFVLDGALALALPTRLGQTLTVLPSDNDGLKWTSLDVNGEEWFNGKFDLPTLSYQEGTDEQVGKRLTEMFASIKKQRPDFLKDIKKIAVETKLEFPRKWGLGSSSTLLFALAKWSDTDPYQILGESLGGSGYDIACAGADGPIIFQRHQDGIMTRPSHFDPSFKNHLYFVYLGKKQDSREGIRLYREKAGNLKQQINHITVITQRILSATTLNEFQRLIEHHERLVGNALGLPLVKEALFPDYWGCVKSLGAWGGDFVMATSNRTPFETRNYFVEKGLETCLSYDELILTA